MLRWFEDRSHWFMALVLITISIQMLYITIHSAVPRHDILAITIGVFYSLSIGWLAYMFAFRLRYSKRKNK